MLRDLVITRDRISNLNLLAIGNSGAVGGEGGESLLSIKYVV